MYIGRYRDKIKIFRESPTKMNFYVHRKMSGYKKFKLFIKYKRRNPRIFEKFVYMKIEVICKFFIKHWERYYKISKKCPLSSERVIHSERNGIAKTKESEVSK